MKTFLGLILLVLFGRGVHATENLRVYDQASKKYVQVDLVLHDGITVTATCKKAKGFDCDALKTKLIKNPKLSKVPLLGNPASTFCAKVGGMSRILLDSKNAEYDFCLFKDGSMADSWELFNKRANK